VDTIPKPIFGPFGCIAYELCTKEKAFSGDWETRDYLSTFHRSPKKMFNDSQGWPRGTAAEVAKNISELMVGRCLHVAWEERPSASELQI